MNDYSTENLGKRLAAIREELNLKQSTIGDVLGCSNGAYSLYERGKRQPQISVIVNLCDNFGVSADYLLGCFSPFPHIFSDRLNQVIRAQENQKSLEEFCETYSLKKEAANLLVSGRCFPNAKTLAKLGRYFDCSVDYLIGLSDAMYPTDEVPVRIGSSKLKIAPFAELDPDLRSKAEGYIDSLLEQQKERQKRTQIQEA